MNWHREIDYHGSRSYGADVPRAGHFTAFIAWLAKFGGRKPQSRSSTALLSGEHGFSLLGLHGSRVTRAADCPFPIKAADQYDRRDWRLLP